MKARDFVHDIALNKNDPNNLDALISNPNFVINQNVYDMFDTSYIIKNFGYLQRVKLEKH